jgi:hypothetical protein
LSPSIYKTFAWDDFSGGYNTDLDAEKLPRNYLSGGQQVQYIGAVLTKRDGKQLFNPSLTPSGTIIGVYVFQQSTGQTYPIVLTTTTIYALIGSTWTNITPTTGSPPSPVTLRGQVGMTPVFATWQDNLYVTNGFDSIIKWNGNTSQVATFISGNGAPTTCRAIIPFTSYLFAIRPSGFNFRVMWSDYLNDSVWNSGQAGAVDLGDVPEILMGATVSGRWMTVYKQHALYNVTFVGPPIYFDFRRIDAPGTIATGSLLKIPQLGVFYLGSDDVYLFDGSMAHPIGKPIRRELFKNLDWNALDSIVAFLREDVGRVYLCVPFAPSNGYPNMVYTYNYIDGQWLPEGPYSILAGTWAQYGQGMTVGQATQPISSYTMTIQSLYQASQRVGVVSDGSQLYAILPNLATDNNNAISSSFTTSASPLAVDDSNNVIPCMVYGIDILGNGLPGTHTLTLYASIGNNRYTPYTFQFSFGPNEWVTIPCEVYGERFKVSVANGNNNESFQIKEIRLKFRPRSVRRP